MKRLVKKTKGLIKGVPSAVLISALIPAALFFAAGTLVVFSVIKKHEKKFVPPPLIERPKMDLKKPKVKVTKTVKPRASQRITSSSVQSMPEISLPEVSGAGSGLRGGGFEMMPDPAEMTLFGGKSSMAIGNDFEGTFYSLQYDRQGKPTGISDMLYMKETRRFLENGWDPRVLTHFFRSPQKLYATQLMIPPISFEFGMPSGAEFDPIHGCVHYKGKIANKEGGALPLSRSRG